MAGKRGKAVERTAAPLSAQAAAAGERQRLRALDGAASVLARLRQHDGLPPTARRIAAFIAAQPADVVRMSITEVAEQVGASEGSIVGLCRRLGATGFQDLKIMLAGEVVEPIRFIQEDLVETDGIDQICDKVFAAHVDSLTQTRKLLSPETMAEAVGRITGARRIEAYGIGSSSPMVQDLAYRLMQLGMDCRPVVDSHMQAVSAAMTGPDVTVIVVSHSGSTVETVTAARLAHDAGAKIVGITRFGKSPLQRYCNVVLHTLANETRYRPEAMSSRVAQLAIIDALVSGCALSRAKASVDNLQRSARVLSEKRY